MFEISINWPLFFCNLMTIVKPSKKILLMMVLGFVGLVIQIILSSLYPASEYSFTLGIGLAIFGIIIAIMIILYSKARNEISKM